MREPIQFKVFCHSQQYFLNHSPKSNTLTTELILTPSELVFMTINILKPRVKNHGGPNQKLEKRGMKNGERATI